MHQARIDCVQLEIPIETERVGKSFCRVEMNREFSLTQWLTSSSTTCGKEGNCKHSAREKEKSERRRLDARFPFKPHDTKTRPSARDITAFESPLTRFINSRRREQRVIPRVWYSYEPLTFSCWHWTEHKTTIKLIFKYSLKTIFIPLFHDQTF